MSFTETKKNHNLMSTINAIKLNNSLFINQHNKLKLKIMLKEKKNVQIRGESYDESKYEKH